ncbi:MAG: QueT transporter family protein [Candidatus Coproplasma sp.]
MTKRKIAILMICRAGIIAALYVALTLPFAQFAFGPFQIRPAEALTILPLFYPEAIAGLYVGCILVNIISVYGIYDVLLGSLATLIAAALTFVIGKYIKNKALKIAIGGIPPVVLNAFLVPAIWLLAGSDIAYWTEFAIMLLNESIWVYALGIPLYITFDRLIVKGGKGIIPYSLIKEK